MALLRGVSTHLYTSKVYGMAVPYSQSLIPPEFVYVAVSSAGVKMQDGEKRRSERKKPTQNKNLNKPNKRKKDIQAVGSRIP